MLRRAQVLRAPPVMERWQQGLNPKATFLVREKLGKDSVDSQKIIKRFEQPWLGRRMRRVLNEATEPEASYNSLVQFSLQNEFPTLYDAAFALQNLKERDVSMKLTTDKAKIAAIVNNWEQYKAMRLEKLKSEPRANRLVRLSTEE
ncbi:hypothetical protein DIPPA_01994 [Diplonema papillatum]|nr:hypothetical protein DIPPA_01994 [Diplonema papillatum]